jgi:hypothetical protein
MLDLSGVLERSNTRQDLNATYMAGLDSPAISKFMDGFFRFNGVQWLTEFTRAAAGRSAFYAIASWKKMAEDQKVIMRNARRDANKHADALKNNPAKHIPEDEIEQLKTEIQELLKKYEAETDKRLDDKTKEIMTI